jgi:hypothetical protein
MKLFASTTSALLIFSLLTGCATIMSHNKWPLAVNSTPKGAYIEITDKKGQLVFDGYTPAFLELKSGAGFFSKQSYKVRISMDGYEEREIPVECNLNGWYLGNLVFGGFIGFLIVDPATGAMYKLDKKFVNVKLKEVSSSKAPSLRIMDINELTDDERSNLVRME